MKRHIITALFRRNFTSYFSSPIGYVFICAFVLLTAIAAFWPTEFFNANLANLDQLNDKLPWIMLVFIPAITMGVWAEERRQGTDELLLTLPATDLEIVTGKYLAAVAIFTVSLLFSVSNIVVLIGLGKPDLGLLAANYIGYWFVGSAMIAVGTVASFMTRNLTVGFILAAALNAPLVFAVSAQVIIPWSALARIARDMSISAQFGDFARGVLALSSVAYFVGIAVFGLYLCMILIGRRHWHARAEVVPMAVHYAVRAVALLVIVVGVVAVTNRFDLRLDLTSERLSSLSPETKQLLADLDPERPVIIEAYVSPIVPEAYVQTRLNLLTMLREVDSRGGDKLIVRINEADRFSEAAVEAEQQFGIRPQAVQDRTAGQYSVSDVMLGAAFMCGLDKVVVPFFDRGIPVEYEVVRSITTVSQQERMKIGVLGTDARLFGGFDMQSMSSRPDQPIIGELRKQYDVVQVDPSSPITERYDALLAVQPSSLPQPKLDNFLTAVRAGQPTAIFEDPFPFFDPAVVGTAEPRRPPRANPFQQQPPPEPKGRIEPLWRMLGVDLEDRVVVWDDYNPYPKIAEFPREFVFVGAGAGGETPFNTAEPSTATLQQVLLLFPGSIRIEPDSPAKPLLKAGAQTGTVASNQIVQQTIFGRGGLNPARRHTPTGEPYLLAARITGPPSDAATDEGVPPIDLDVTLVSDIDVLYPVFFSLRARGDEPDSPVNFDLDNVTFALNVLDDLAGDDRFIEIRGRRPRHRTLTAVERRTEDARDEASEQREQFIDQFETQRAEEERLLNERVDQLRQRTDIDPRQLNLEVSTAMQVGQNRLQAKINELQRQRDQELDRIERDLSLEVRQVQNTYKLAAVGLPPIPPLLVGAFVYLRRRSMETIGVPKSRLRGGSGGSA